MPTSRPIRLRTILLWINLIILILPLCSLYLLRIYDNELIRQTESELISQAAFISAIYKDKVQSTLAESGIPVKSYGLPLDVNTNSTEPFKAVTARLDLSKDKIYSPRPAPEVTDRKPHPVALSSGKALQAVLKDAQQITLSGIKILDYQGIVVGGQEEIEFSFAHTEEFQKARQGINLSLLRVRRMPVKPAPLDSLSRGSKINVFLAMPIILEDRLIGVVWLNRTPRELMQALYEKRRGLTIGAIVLLMTTLLLSFLISYTITKPLDALIDQTRRIARGDKSANQPIPSPVTHEMAVLSRSIAEMAQTIEHRSDYIRNFATHVSHEFKTPITAIQGTVELLQEHLANMPPEKREQFLNNIAQDTERLKRLVNRLLELARADMSQSLMDTTELITTIHTLADRYREKGLALSITNTLETAEVKATIAPESWEAILTNLLENSLQHKADSVQVTLKTLPPDETGREHIGICLADNGSGISDANRRQVFTPFFTTRRQEGGTGMGLSITQSLLQGVGGTITLEPTQTGASFFITLLKA